MGKLRPGVHPQIRFDLIPVTLVVADLFAAGANRDDAAQFLDFAERATQRIGLFADAMVSWAKRTTTAISPAITSSAIASAM